MLTYILNLVELNRKAKIALRKNLDEKVSWFNAIKDDDLAVVKDLIEKDFDIEIVNEKGNTALLIASKEGYFDIVEYLVEHQADVNVSNEAGDTALMLAIQENHIEIAQYLI
ncbi:hypothetical protein PIROE2DRAFT_37789, partial [Piromyces sp. E2]